MATNSAPVVISLAAKLPSMRLPSPATIAASKGRKTMSWTVIAVTPRNGSIATADSASPDDSATPHPFIWLMSSTAIVPRPRK